MRNVDPIRYAWEACNRNVPFPAELVRGAAASSAASGSSGTEGDLLTERTAVAAVVVEAALQSFVVGDVRPLTEPAAPEGPHTEAEDPMPAPSHQAAA